jgi:hypothetical protein
LALLEACCAKFAPNRERQMVARITGEKIAVTDWFGRDRLLRRL